MVVLTIARRLLIFTVFLTLLANGVLLVMARQARTQRADDRPKNFVVRVDLKTKAQADGLVHTLQKGEPGMKFTSRVSRHVRVETRPTGQFYVGLEIDASLAGSVAKMLVQSGHLVKIEDVGNGKRMIRLAEVFHTRAQAQAKATAVNNGISNAAALVPSEVQKSVKIPVFEVEITVYQEDTFNTLKQFVTAHVPRGALEP